MLLALLLGLAHPETPAYNYQTYPTQPAVALPYDASRLSPRLSDYTSTLGAMVLTTGDVPPAAAAKPEHLAQLGDADQPDLYSDLFGDSQVLSPEEAAARGLLVSAADESQEVQDLRARIKALEEQLQAGGQPPPVPQSPPAPVTHSAPGWVAEVFDWNKSGRLGQDALRTILTRNCAFNGTFAATSSDSLYIYRFSSIFRVREPGRYVFAFDTTCSWGHPCSLRASVDGGQIIDFRGQQEAGRIQNGLPLEVGDHRLEFTIHLNNQSYVKYEPGERFKWQPLVKGPSDLNARDFREDELFLSIPPSVKGTVRSCTY